MRKCAVSAAHLNSTTTKLNLHKLQLNHVVQHNIKELDDIWLSFCQSKQQTEQHTHPHTTATYDKLKIDLNKKTSKTKKTTAHWTKPSQTLTTSGVNAVNLVGSTVAASCAIRCGWLFSIVAFCLFCYCVMSILLYFSFTWLWRWPISTRSIEGGARTTRLTLFFSRNWSSWFG